MKLLVDSTIATNCGLNLDRVQVVVLESIEIELKCSRGMDRVVDGCKGGAKLKPL